MNKTIEYYNKNAKEFCKSTLNADMSFCREKFMELLPCGSSILDAGCGSGRDAKAFIEAGLDVTAMDASPEVCREADVLLSEAEALHGETGVRGRVICMAFEDMDFKSCFDGVWACASLLHVGKDAIDPVMDRVAMALKPGGVLYVSFKQGAGEATVYDRFFNYYDEKGLGELLENHGFEIKDIFVTEDVRDDRLNEKWVNGIARKAAEILHERQIESYGGHIVFRKVRKVKNEITIEEAKKLLNNNKRAALSVNGDDGYPYTVPINFYYDEEENKIYFHSAKKGHKIDSIINSNKVCLTTWNDGYTDDGDWAYHVSSCVVFGKARLINDLETTEDKLRKFALKYYPSADEAEKEIKAGIKGVQMVEIEIEHISGKMVHEK